MQGGKKAVGVSAPGALLSAAYWNHSSTPIVAHFSARKTFRMIVIWSDSIGESARVAAFPRS